MKFIKYTWPFFLLLSFSCDEGIAPGVELPEPGFSGTVTFIGDWPQNVTRTHIVLFKEPLEDSTDFNILNLGFISEEIPFNSTEYNYNTSINAVIGGIEAREYAYLAVAQSRKPALSLLRKDWFVVGIYCNETDVTCTGRLLVPVGVFLENINIMVDFNNPPP